jgi:hypothetical protein
MPGLDRTGPQGQGSMTGGARGNCNNANAAGSRFALGNQGFGRKMGFGRRNFSRSNGYGMGMRQRYAENIQPSGDDLRNEVELLNRRIAELENIK